MYSLREDERHVFSSELCDYIPTRIKDLRMGDIVLVNEKNSVIIELIYEFGMPKVGDVVDFKTRPFDVCRESMYKAKVENKRWTTD